MANLSQVIWTVVLTIIVSRFQALGDNDFRFSLPENDRFPSTNFVPEKLRISDEAYDRLLGHLDDQFAEEGVNMPLNDYFPKDVESDEVDDLEFVHEYDLAEDDDADFISNLPNDASASTDFGKREFKFAKVLAISKNGTKTFTKFRQSVKVGGNATTTATGNFNTTLYVITSASGLFDANSTYFSKGQHKHVAASGTAATSSSSKSKVEKRRLFQRASADSSITLKIPALVHINSSVRSGSETLKLPFRSFLTLFKSQANTTGENIFKMRSTLAGEVISRVAFANKTVSLTKSCIKAYVKSKFVGNDEDVDDSSFKEHDQRNDDAADEENAAASPSLFQISLIRAKTHTWTKVVSQSKTEVVIDVITCTKARVYGKSVKRGALVIFTGSGQVSWEKSRITIAAKRLHKLSPHEYGVHFIQNHLESSSVNQFLGSPFETTM